MQCIGKANICKNIGRVCAYCATCSRSKNNFLLFLERGNLQIMAYTAAQQAKIDAAQTLLDAAKTKWNSWVGYYDSHFIKFNQCYTGKWYDAYQAASWFNPTKGPCTGQGSCTLSDCKDLVDYFNDYIIPNLRSAFAELQGAQTNFNTVLAAVIAEAAGDPSVIIQQQQIQAQAQVEAAAKKQKYIFYAIVAVVIGITVFVYFKFIRK